MVFTPPTHAVVSVQAPTPPPPSQLPVSVCASSLLTVALSPFPSPFSEAGDMQALANLNTVAKQYLRLHESQCWF